MFFRRLASLSALLIPGFLVITLIGCEGTSGTSLTDSDGASDTSEEEWTIPEGQPAPAVVVDEQTYQFGVMQINTEGEHTYTLRNEGKGPLRIKTIGTTCKCTLPDDKDEILQPGESTEVTLKWKPETNGSFRQEAKIKTNDPENPVVTLEIVGTVSTSFNHYPPGEWLIGQMNLDAPTTTSGSVYSSIHDKFEIVSIEPDSPLVTVETKPLDEEKLAELEIEEKGSGYEILCEVKPGSPIGKFETNLKLSLKADDGQTEQRVIKLNGFQPGPMTVVGPGWYAKENLVQMGRFNSEDGKEHKLWINVQKREGEPVPIEFELVDSKPVFIDLKFEHDPDFPSPKYDRYEMTVVIPPGITPTLLDNNNPGIATVKTNRSDMSEIQFAIHLLAR